MWMLGSVELAARPFKCYTVWVTAALKDKGNEAYAQEDYETAVKYYSDGLAELPDMQQLYTNRAQVNIFNLYSFSLYKWFIVTQWRFGFRRHLKATCRLPSVDLNFYIIMAMCN